MAEQQNPGVSRICIDCKNNLPIEQFWKGRKKSSSTRRRCKNCNYLRVKSYHENYNSTHKEQRAKWSRDYHKTENGQKAYKNYYQRRKDNPHYDKMRDILTKFLGRKNRKKLDRTHNLLGYSCLDFKERFPNIVPGYQIDHKIPIAWFIDTVPANIVNNLDNLQMIESSINSSKQARYCDSVNESFYSQAIDWVKEEYKDKVLYGRSTK